MALMYLPLNLDTMDWLMPAIFVVATVLQFWAGRGFYAAAWAAARHGATNMNTLVALGTGVAWGYSAFVTLWPGIAERAGLPLHLYFETSLVIIALILMGRWMELRARKRTAAAITALVGLAPKTARVIRDGRGPAVTHTATPRTDRARSHKLRARSLLRTRQRATRRSGPCASSRSGLPLEQSRAAGCLMAHPATNMRK